MNVSTIEVVSNRSARVVVPLAKAVDVAVAAFLDEEGGTLEDYKLSGTVLEDGIAEGKAVVCGKTLVTINWTNGGKKKKNGKK